MIGDVCVFGGYNIYSVLGYGWNEYFGYKGKEIFLNFFFVMF